MSIWRLLQQLIQCKSLNKLLILWLKGFQRFFQWIFHLTACTCNILLFWISGKRQVHLNWDHKCIEVYLYFIRYFLFFDRLPNPAFYDYFRSPEIPVHPGFVHPYMFPAFAEQNLHFQSMAAAVARPQTVKSGKSVTSPKVASPAVLDLTRLPHMMASSFNTTSTTSSTESPKRAGKRSSSSSESVLDLSVKRPKLHASSIFDIPKCNVESPFNAHAYRLQQDLYGAWRNEQSALSNLKNTHVLNGKMSKNDGTSCQCAENSTKDIRNWSVERVGQFLKGLEGCSPYVKVIVLSLSGCAQHETILIVTQGYRCNTILLWLSRLFNQLLKLRSKLKIQLKFYLAGFSRE